MVVGAQKASTRLELVISTALTNQGEARQGVNSNSGCKVDFFNLSSSFRMHHRCSKKNVKLTSSLNSSSRLLLLIVVVLLLIDNESIKSANGQLEAVGAVLSVVPVTSILATAGLVGVKLAALSRLLQALGYDNTYLANNIGHGTAAAPIGLQSNYAYMFPYVPGLNVSVKGEHSTSFKNDAAKMGQNSKGGASKTFPSMGLPGDYEHQSRPFRGSETLKAIFRDSGFTLKPPMQQNHLKQQQQQQQIVGATKGNGNTNNVKTVSNFNNNRENINIQQSVATPNFDAMNGFGNLQQQKQSQPLKQQPPVVAAPPPPPPPATSGQLQQSNQASASLVDQQAELPRVSPAPAASQNTQVSIASFSPLPSISVGATQAAAAQAIAQAAGKTASPTNQPSPFATKSPQHNPFSHLPLPVQQQQPVSPPQASIPTIPEAPHFSHPDTHHRSSHLGPLISSLKSSATKSPHQPLPPSSQSGLGSESKPPSPPELNKHPFSHPNTHRSSQLGPPVFSFISREPKKPPKQARPEPVLKPELEPPKPQPPSIELNKHPFSHPNARGNSKPLIEPIFDNNPQSSLPLLPHLPELPNSNGGLPRPGPQQFHHPQHAAGIHQAGPHVPAPPALQSTPRPSGWGFGMPGLSSVASIFTTEPTPEVHSVPQHDYFHNRIQAGHAGVSHPPARHATQNQPLPTGTLVPARPLAPANPSKPASTFEEIFRELFGSGGPQATTSPPAPSTTTGSGSESLGVSPNPNEMTTNVAPVLSATSVNFPPFHDEMEQSGLSAHDRRKRDSNSTLGMSWANRFFGPQAKHAVPEKAIVQLPAEPEQPKQQAQQPKPQVSAGVKQDHLRDTFGMPAVNIHSLRKRRSLGSLILSSSRQV